MKSIGFITSIGKDAMKLKPRLPFPESSPNDSGFFYIYIVVIIEIFDEMMESVISINDLLELCGDDQGFVKEIIGLTRDELKEDIIELKKFFTTKNFVELRNISHKIKGQAANMMAEKMRKKAESVEANSKKGSCSETEYITLVSSIEEFLQCTQGYQEYIFSR